MTNADRLVVRRLASVLPGVFMVLLSGPLVTLPHAICKIALGNWCGAERLWVGRLLGWTALTTGCLLIVIAPGLRSRSAESRASRFRPLALFFIRTLVVVGVIVATGLSVPNIPPIPGIHLAQGYEDLTLNVDKFENKSVLILGEPKIRLFGCGTSRFRARKCGLRSCTAHLRCD